MNICVLLISVILVFMSAEGAIIGDECSDRTSCPENSSCRPLSCQGYQCACMLGYMAADNDTKCIKGALLEMPCDPDHLQCLTENSVCVKGFMSLTSPHCRCEKGYINTDRLQCLPLTCEKRYSQSCENDCGPTLACTGGFCQCKAGYRLRTKLEVQLDRNYALDCIQNEYNLSLCNDKLVQPNRSMFTDITYDTLKSLIATNESDFNANGPTLPRITNSLNSSDSSFMFDEILSQNNSTFLESDSTTLFSDIPSEPISTISPGMQNVSPLQSEMMSKLQTFNSSEEFSLPTSNSIPPLNDTFQLEQTSTFLSYMLSVVPPDVPINASSGQNTVTFHIQTSTNLTLPTVTFPLPHNQSTVSADTTLYSVSSQRRPTEKINTESPLTPVTQEPVLNTEGSGTPSTRTIFFSTSTLHTSTLAMSQSQPLATVPVPIAVPAQSQSITTTTTTLEQTTPSLLFRTMSTLFVRLTNVPRLNSTRQFQRDTTSTILSSKIPSSSTNSETLSETDASQTSSNISSVQNVTSPSFSTSSSSSSMVELLRMTSQMANQTTVVSMLPPFLMLQTRPVGPITTTSSRHTRPNLPSRVTSELETWTTFVSTVLPTVIVSQTTPTVGSTVTTPSSNLLTRRILLLNSSATSPLTTTATNTAIRYISTDTPTETIHPSATSPLTTTTTNTVIHYISTNTPTETIPPLDPSNRVVIEPIVIASVVVILPLLIFFTIIGAFIYHEKRFHLSLATADNDTNSHKQSRCNTTSGQTEMSQSAVNDNINQPSFHYLNEAFYEERV